jgi:hypothetical protein
MGLYELLTSPTGNVFYTQNPAFVNPNSVSTSAIFSQRNIPWPDNNPQPYVRIPLPPVTPIEGSLLFDIRNGIRYNSNRWGPDFLTRGNLYGLVRTADDIQRLTKYFFDFTNVGKGGDVSGLFFTLKQNLLSAAGDTTAYTPLSTLTQVAINLSGASVKKQGFDAGIISNSNTQAGNSVFLQFAGASTYLMPSEDFRKKPLEAALNKPDNVEIKWDKETGDNIVTTTPSSPSYKITYLSASPSYKGIGNIEIRTNFRSGGVTGNISNYQRGKRLVSSPDTSLGPLDTINAIPIYQSETVTDNPITKDLIDFRIAVIDNTTIGSNALQNLYMHFRAYLKNFGDTYNADWKTVEYMGRAEKFYRYGGFKRSISLGFTLAASSKEELMPMYKKLNFLASSLAPSYSEAGYMRGNIAKITVGNYLYEQPGVIESLDITMPDDSPWEINLGLDGGSMEDMRQLPQMLEVKMKFSPIHEFRPEIMKLSGLQNATDFKPDNVLEKDPSYGQQRFISLKDQTNGWEGSYDRPNT